MAGVSIRLALVALLASCSGGIANVAGVGISPDLLVVKAARTGDLTTHLPKITTRYTLENTGTSGAIKSFLVALDPVLAEYLSFIGASVSFF